MTKTEATLSCTFNFEDTADYDVYFRYKPASSGSYDRVNVSTGTGTKTAALTGLTPGTTYEFALCADWDGQTYTSAAATFTTSSDGGGGNTGSAKYSGWPEPGSGGQVEQRLSLCLSPLPGLSGDRYEGA